MTFNSIVRWCFFFIFISFNAFVLVPVHKYYNNNPSRNDIKRDTRSGISIWQNFFLFMHVDTKIRSESFCLNVWDYRHNLTCLTVYRAERVYYWQQQQITRLQSRVDEKDGERWGDLTNIPCCLQGMGRCGSQRLYSYSRLHNNMRTRWCGIIFE